MPESIPKVEDNISGDDISHLSFLTDNLGGVGDTIKAGEDIFGSGIPAIDDENTNPNPPGTMAHALWEQSRKLSSQKPKQEAPKAAPLAEGEEPNPHAPGTMALALWEQAKKPTSATPKETPKAEPLADGEEPNPHPPGSMGY